MTTRPFANLTGYVDEIPYTPLYIKYQTPFRLACVGQANGVSVPDISRPFRYLDLGCGPGKTLNILADIHPHASFVGVDLNPDHVNQARNTAQRSGLSNVTVHLADFAGFLSSAQHPFDFIVAHGVYSWVGTAVRDEIHQIVDRYLAPGGMLYLSYFDAAAARDTIDLFEMVRETRTTLSGSVSETTVAAVKNLARNIATHPERYKDAENLAERVNGLLARDHRYLVHEFGNETLAGIDCTDLKLRLGQVGIEYVGDARRFGVRPPPHADPATAAPEPFRWDVFSRAQPKSGKAGRPVVWSSLPLETRLTADTKAPLSGRTPEQATVDLTVGSCPAMPMIIRQCQERGRPLSAHAKFRALQIDDAEDAVTRLVATGHVSPLLFQSRPSIATAKDRFHVPSSLNRLELSQTLFTEGRVDLASAISGEAVTLDFMDGVLLHSLEGNTFAQACDIAHRTIRSLDDNALLLPERVKSVARSTRWLVGRSVTFRRTVLPSLLRRGIVELRARTDC